MEQRPPPACHISPMSKKRVFPGGSSTCMEEAEMVEIVPSLSCSSKSKFIKQREVIRPCSVIKDVDVDEECAGLGLASREANAPGKDKHTFAKFSLGSSSGFSKFEEGDAAESSRGNHVNGLHYLHEADDIGSHILYGDKEYQKYCDDPYYKGCFSILQSRFNDMDMPPGIEISPTWFKSNKVKKMKSGIGCTSVHSTSDIQPNSTESSSLPWSLALERVKDETATGGSLIHSTALDPVDIATRIETLPFPYPFESKHISGMPVTRGSSTPGIQFEVEKLRSFPEWSSVDGVLPKKHDVSGIGQLDSYKDLTEPSTEVKVPKSFGCPENLHCKRKLWADKSMVDSSLENQFPTVENKVPKTKKSVGNGSLFEPCSYTQTGMNGHGVLGHSRKVHEYKAGQPSISASLHLGFFDSSTFDTFPDKRFLDTMESDNYLTAEDRLSNLSGLSSSKRDYGIPDSFLKNFDLFKKFDTVEDHSDHHYSRTGYCMNQPSKSWARKIQEEWRILEKDLPETIFVRVYESRMDLLRTIIIGAEGTPYHDGLFFFDIFFPASYPSIPPRVHYHSGGLHINPNLYSNGKVCLSLLNTWVGNPKEKWMPGVSTVLQLLVSIQALILNAKPYFNEPAHEKESGTAIGEQSSLQYNEDIFIYSLKTMVYTIRMPPKNFEDFVAGHFYKRARDILVACKAYINGAQVGSLVKGVVQEVEGDKSSSQYFKDALAKCMKILVEAFAQVGVKDCENFLGVAVKVVVV